MMAGCWWFFCLIIVSSYTANLAACLAIAANIPAFSNVEELARQKVIKYGAKNGGSTFDFFKVSFKSDDPFDMLRNKKTGKKEFISFTIKKNYTYSIAIHGGIHVTSIKVRLKLDGLDRIPCWI